MEALDEGAELWFATKQMEQKQVCLDAPVVNVCEAVVKRQL